MASPLQAVNVRAASSAARPKRQQSWKLKNARTTPAANDNRPSQERRAVNDNTPIQYGQTQRNLRQAGRHRINEERELSSRGATGTVSTLKAKARAVRVSWTIAGTVLPFYMTQLIFGLIAFAGAGAEYAGEEFIWGIASTIIPGEYIFAAGWLGAAIIAILMIGAAALIYTANRVNCWDNISMSSFFVCIALCFAPFANIFPWVILWMVFVVYAQK